MAEKIHYDDNIFFLTVMIQSLHDALQINIDAEYFAEKILEDSMFINTSIQKIYKTLTENRNLINAPSYLHSVMKAKVVYGRLIDAILHSEGDFSVIFKTKSSQLQQIAASHREDVQIIKEKLSNINDKNIISFDELNILMSPIEENVEPQYSRA
ncbi:MAG: hypothetical protein B0D92_00415 [Spirochaeta sp. LUC14_002_19_P3]|nr:MAG: hypothetical protein B0D92_00415 [Spirochaeta sp. LUC14_002_19_P3]